MPRHAALILAGLVVQAALFGQPPSSTSLTATPNPSNYGQPVILTATVTSGATGKVTFYDGVTILGVGTLSGSQASISTVMLQSGNRNLRAYYHGNGTYAASSSGPVPQTVVAGKSIGFHPPVSYPIPTNTTIDAMAVGDFNGDSRLDFVTICGDCNSITIYLGNGDGTFRTGATYTVDSDPGSVTVGDFNGDGRMDLALANYYSNNIAILLGNGDGTFQPPTYYPVGVAPNSIVVADFNGDGLADLIVSNFRATGLSLLLGKGDGTFQAAASVAAGGAATSVAIADFNGDGAADLVVALQSPAAIGILLGIGNGTFQPVQVDSMTNPPNTVSTADFNGDGKADILVTAANYTGVYVLLGNGDGTFGSPLTYPTGFNPSSVSIADFNGDGIEDLAIIPYVSNNQDYVGIGPGNGDGTFGTVALYPVSNTSNAGAVGDFNGDGKTDLVVAIDFSARYTIYLGGAAPDLTIAASHGAGFTQNQQGATYSITVTNSGDFASFGPAGVVAAFPPALTAASISGNGWSCTLATLACVRDDSLPPGASYSAIVLKVNVGNVTGNVTSAFTVSGGGEINAANDVAADTAFLRYQTTTTLTASPRPSALGQTVTLTATVTAGATGRVDFYAGTLDLGSAPIVSGQSVFTTSVLPSGVTSLHAYYGGDTSYGPSVSATRAQTVNPVPSDGLQPSNNYPVDYGPYWIGTTDLNGDGKADLVTVNNGINYAATISVLLGNGDGTFRKMGNYPVGSSFYQSSGAVIADFNNDGKPDIAVGTNAGIFLLAGNGDGSFGTAKLVSPANNYTSLVSADFNGDGIPDIVAIAGTIVLFAGNGDGTFQAPVSLGSTEASYGAVSVADMNGDGKPDLVAASSSSTSNPIVSVFLGNGDGTFQQPVNSSPIVITSYLNSMVVGDFNGDGKPDVAITYWQDVAVMLGNGDGTLQPPIQSNLYQGLAYYVVAGDFNGDGKLDIAYITIGLGGVWIALGNGDGTFQASYGSSPSAPGGAGEIALGDFNGDGKPDFAVSDYGANTVDIYLGGQFSGLTITSTHRGRFTAGQTGTYQITVTNSTFTTSTLPVTVTDTLPYGLTATAIGGTGWTCTLSSLTCTRSDWLNNNTSYPVITLTVTVSTALTPSVIGNQATATVGSIANSVTDSTTIVSPTTTTLTASPNPSILGQPVTLTATVTAGATGSVTFFAGANPLLAAPVGDGQANIVTPLLPTGRNAVRAVYDGDATHGSSSGTTYQPVNSAPASGFSAAATYATGGGPQAIASGDFNRDGKTDLVTANTVANTVSVLLGRGDGTFGTNTDYAAGNHPTSVVVADFNNDGWQDIAVASSNTVVVLLGNGDGTFQPAITTAAVNAAYLAASDFNGDGKMDVALFNSDYSFSVLLGNGDGTFQADFRYASTTVPAEAVGDFNLNGKFDVDTVYDLMVGNGDGTFQVNPLSTGVTGFTAALTAGDLNADGKPDVVATLAGGVDVVLGNGDGTFQQAVSYPTSTSPIAVVLADVNGDGNLDVVVVNPAPNSLSVLYGNGDGTLQAAISVPLAVSSQAAVAGDFNGDGRTDLAIANSGNNTVTVLLGVLSPVFTITSSHTDPFGLGEIGATYTITLTNNGPGVTAGLVSVTDTLPAGLTATAIGRAGWSCTLANLTCTRSDSLPVGASYSISVTVNVIATNTGIVINQATASGGGAVAATGYDPTTIIGPAITIQTNPSGLRFSMDNAAAQTAPQTTYLPPGPHTLAVTSPQSAPGTQYLFSNWSDSGAASHTITVGTTAATYTASFQTQYQLTTASYPQAGGSVMPASGTYYNAGTPVTLTPTPNPPFVFATWSGGVTGAANPLQTTMNAPTSVTAIFDIPGPTCTMTGDTTASVADVQFIINEALGVVPANNDLNGDGVVNIADVQKVIGAAMSLSCLH
jgi:uncharacterized repeat protein (TIGR01451 family)